MKYGIGETLRLASEKKTKDEFITFLRENYTKQLGDILKLALHPDTVWLLPKGEIPYKRNTYLVDLENVLYYEAKKLYLYVAGGHATLSQTRREQLFIQLLENVAPDDADLLLSIKDGRLPFQINKKLVAEAYPGLLPWLETKKEETIAPIPPEKVKKESKKQSKPKGTNKAKKDGQITQVSKA